MKDKYALLTENDPRLSKLLFSVVGMIDKNGIMHIVSDDLKYEKFSDLLLELRTSVKKALGDNKEFDDEEIPF